MKQIIHASSKNEAIKRAKEINSKLKFEKVYKYGLLKNHFYQFC